MPEASSKSGFIVSATITAFSQRPKQRAGTRYHLRPCPLFYSPPGDSSFNIPVNTLDIGRAKVFTVLRKASTDDFMASLFG
ncbi:hypothetical protein ES703_57590 [subsurface metagenome]